MQILKVVFVIIGTLIGAGFASGKGLLGIIISSILIGIIIYKTLKIVTEKNVDNYKKFLDYFIKNETVKNIINTTINIFILLSFYIMIAGFGAYLQQEYEINSIIGSTILGILCYFLFKTNVNGIIKINEILIPILIAVVTIIGIINFKNLDITNIKYYITTQNTKSWLITGILYASYNCVLLIPVLITMKEFIKKKTDIKYIAYIVTTIVIILLSTVYMLLINIDVDINKLEMPAVYAINRICPIMKNIYGVIILISIFTTAISLGISFINNISKNKKQFSKIGLLICSTAILFSKIGFANLVNLLYPILGMLGLVQVTLMVVKDNGNKGDGTMGT